MGDIDPNWLPDEAQPDEGDDDVAPEVPTTFATKGLGWSGRENQEDQEDQEADDPLE